MVFIENMLKKGKARATLLMALLDNAQKMKFSIKDLFSKCDQIRRKLWIWSH